MLDDGWFPAARASDRALALGLPPEAPLAMPPQPLERRRRGGLWRLLARGLIMGRA